MLRFVCAFSLPYAGPQAAWLYALDESGLADLFTVLESQRRQLNDATQLIEVRRLLYANRIDLMLALGGAFQSTKYQSAASISDPNLNLSPN